MSPQKKYYGKIVVISLPGQCDPIRLTHLAQKIGLKGIKDSYR